MSTPFVPAPTHDARAPSGAFERPHARGALASPFLPILILALLMLAWFVFQAVQLRGERDIVRDALAGQQKAVEDSKRLRDSLDVIARGTARLSDAGNPNARLLVDELKKRGITISPNEPAPGGTVAP